MFTLVDGFSQMKWMYPLKWKADTFEVSKGWIALVENQTGVLLKCLHSDSGGKFLSMEFKTFLTTKGIKQETTAPGSPQSNSVAKPFNCTLLHGMRCQLHNAGLSGPIWAEATVCTTHMAN